MAKLSRRGLLGAFAAILAAPKALAQALERKEVPVDFWGPPKRNMGIQWPDEEPFSPWRCALGPDELSLWGRPAERRRTCATCAHWDEAIRYDCGYTELLRHPRGSSRGYGLCARGAPPYSSIDATSPAHTCDDWKPREPMTRED